jgi:hypothetical protein
MQMEKLYDLAWAIEGNTINLEQDCGSGEVHRIDLHPMHVRMLAQRLGMFNGDGDAWRRVATLERRMRLLLARIDRLDTLLLNAAARGHEGLEAETIYSGATLDLATEFCAEMNAAGEQETEPEPSDNPRETPRVPVGSQCGLQLEVPR